jgi:flagellar basal body-associated protein FliL
MALDREELNRRREAREAARKQRQKAKRRMTIRLILAVVVLVACGVGIYALVGTTGEPIQPVISTQSDVPEVKETEPPETEAPTERSEAWEQPPVTIKLVAGGDLNITDKVIWSGQ